MRQVKDTKFKIFKADLWNFKPASIKINGNINAKYTQILKQVLSKIFPLTWKEVVPKSSYIVGNVWDRQSQVTNPLGSRLTNAWPIERGKSAKL